MGVNQSYSNPDLVTVGHHFNHPQRVDKKLSRNSTFFGAQNMMMMTECQANVKSTVSTTNTFGLRQRYYHNNNNHHHHQRAQVSSGRRQQAASSTMIDDDITDNNVMQRHSAHFLDEINAANSLSDNDDDNDDDENDDELENYGDEYDDEEEIDEEDEDAQDQSNYGFLASKAQRYSMQQQQQQINFHESTPNFTMNQTAKMEKVKKPKKFNKLFKLISSGSSQKSKSNAGVEKNTTVAASSENVRARDPEKVTNRKKNNLFAKSLVLISGAGFGKSRFNLHEKENEFNKSYAQSTTSINKNNSTKLASKFRQISERIANSSKHQQTAGSSSYLQTNNQTHTASSSHKHKASHHSCSTSSGCSSGASSSNLSSTRRLSTGTKMSQTMLSSSTNSILSSSMAIQSAVLTTNVECAGKLCSTPLNQDHSSSYRNNSYLNGLNTAGDESTSSNVKYSKSMVISPAMYSLDKSNSTSLNSSELNDINMGVSAGAKKSATRAQNRKGNELKSKSMYVENEFMSRNDQEERKLDDDEDNEYKRVKKVSKMDNFKSRLSLKFNKSKSKKSINRELQSSTTASRDSGIFTDLFSHLGSMGNLKGRITNATESLRQSFSVFNLKSSSHGELATDGKINSRRKTLKECNDAYFADNGSVRPVVIQGEIIHHNSVNLKEPGMLNQIAEIVNNGDYHFGCNQVEAMPAPAIVRPSSFKSILKRGASISSATTSSSCGNESAGSSSSKNYDSQLSQFSSTSSSNSFSNFAGSCNLKRTTTFHSTNAHPAVAAASAQASAHYEINRQMSYSGIVNEEAMAAASSQRMFHATVTQQAKQTSSSLIDQSNNANRLITPSSMAANNPAKYSM